MTNREFLNAIVKANLSTAVTEHAKAEIAKLDARNAKRKAAEGEIKEENKPIAKAIVEALSGGKTMLSVELATAIGQTPQKTNGVAGEMCKIGTLVKTKVKVKGKGEQTAYSLPTESATEEVADEVAE